MIALTDAASNVQRAYDAATAAQRADGAAWYESALAVARGLDSNVSQSAGVIAVLSPMMDWPRNIEAAQSIYAGQTPHIGLPANIAKAQRIYGGEDAANVVSGPKVRAFWQNILGNPWPVTLDRHAIDIALGHPASDSDRAAALRGQGRITLTAAYNLVASDLGILPRDLQAITWVAWRQTMAVRKVK